MANVLSTECVINGEYMNNNQLFILGITGGVGAGKSTVLSFLKERYGALVIECDAVGRELQLKGGSCYEPMLELFGKDYLLEDGNFDRAKIAAGIFADPSLKQKLEDIVLPAVKEEVKRRIRKCEEDSRRPMAVIESAILLEEHYDQLCNTVWYVHTDEQVRRERLKASRGYSDEKIDSIMAAQKSSVYFQKQCDLTIDNSSENIENTFKQIEEGLKIHGI